MERIKKIYLPVFEYTITVVITDDIIKSRNNRDAEIGGSSELKNVLGLHSCPDDEAKSWVFLGEDASVNTITHEVFHVIYRLNNWINAEVEQEYFAFHMGYLSQEIFDFLNSKTSNMKKKKKKGTY